MAVKNKIKAVIFDLDGTLADTVGDLSDAMNSMLAHLGYPLKDKPEIIRHVNHGAYNFVKGCLPEDKQSDADIIAAKEIYSKYYAESYCNKTYAYDGMKELCAELKARGVKLAVLSNKQDAFAKIIIEKLYVELFDIVMGGQPEIFPLKPDPSSAIFIAGRFNAYPKECLYVGDSDVDMETALRAGMNAVGVSWGYRSEDILVQAGAAHIIRSAEDLLALL